MLVRTSRTQHLMSNTAGCGSSIAPLGRRPVQERRVYYALQDCRRGSAGRLNCHPVGDCGEVTGNHVYVGVGRKIALICGPLESLSQVDLTHGKPGCEYV